MATGARMHTTASSTAAKAYSDDISFIMIINRINMKTIIYSILLLAILETYVSALRTRRVLQSFTWNVVDETNLD